MSTLPRHALRVTYRSAAERREVRRATSYWEALRDAVAHFFVDDGAVVAGYLAFTAIFALFPFIIFLLALAGFIGETAVAQESIGLAFELVPPEVAAALLPAIEQVRGGKTPGLLTFGIVVALWIASSGLEAARHALDRAYGTHEIPRNFILQRLRSIAYTIVAATAILIATTVMVAGPMIRELLEWLAQRQLFAWNLHALARYGIGMMIFLLLTMFMHMVLPAIRLRPRDVLPGSLLTVAAWALMAFLYSLYLRHGSGYNFTYGSLAGVVLSMFFFYISAALFIFGAQFNGSLRRQRHRILRSREEELLAAAQAAQMHGREQPPEPR
jgi:membrane protein